MTVEVEGVFDEYKRIKNLDSARLKSFKDAHHPGDVIRIIFDDTEDSSFTKAFRLFHVYRDQLANNRGEDKESMKAWLKYKYGSGTLPWVEGFKPPVGERGSFLEVEGRIYWMRSTTVYTGAELGVLIEGVISEINGGVR